MCYMLLLSTDSHEDLTRHNGPLVTFDRVLPPLAELSLLGFEHRWFVASRQGCSCGFRHLHSSATDLGFDTPQDWYPEDSEDLAATLQFIQIVRLLVETGASVDCIDVWGHETDSPTIAGTKQVDLFAMQPEAFRFMEAHRFVFGKAA